jgi:hypothetical protein
MRRWAAGAMILAGAFVSFLPIESGAERPSQITYDQTLYYFYPQLYDRRPDIPSPFITEDGIEIAVVCTKAARYGVFDVTVENDDSLNYINNKQGRGLQLTVDTADFPTLAVTGLHAEQELARTVTITGKPVTEITRIGRPEMSSGVGFMAQDEDVLSILKGDNRLVRRLGLTHPQLARPLFHVWNIVYAHEQVCNRKDRPVENPDWISYDGRKIYIGAGSGHGWQESIFNDEILGMFQLEIWRELTDQEAKFLKEQYPQLTGKQFDELKRKLSYIHTGEMVPYYIRRYGFYEGHTGYRADPIAVALIFGLKSIEQIEQAFDGGLYRTLTEHFTPDK